MTETRVILGDCIVEMRKMPAATFDAVVCDPPYGLEFMGEDWDAPWKHGFNEYGMGDSRGRIAGPVYGSQRNPMCRTCRKHKRGTDRCACAEPDYDESSADLREGFQAWCEVWAKEAFRVLKPGGFMLAFGGTRTYHRLACAVEDVGFEVKDSLLWLYGKGFPKNLNVARTIDKKLGVDVTANENWEQEENPDSGSPPSRARSGYVPATDEAKAWDGWGTALKPAYEPIVCARKPLSGTVAENFLAHGVGGYNIDGCRIGDDAGWSYPNGRGGTAWGRRDSLAGDLQEPKRATVGRWPANVMLAHSPDCRLVGEKTVASNGHFPVARKPSMFGALGHDALAERHTRGEVVEEWECAPGCAVLELDAQSDGGASRFFYSAKVSRAERDAGLDASFERADLNWSSGDESPGTFQSEGTERSVRNHHPTVKPIAVMRWLVRLVTPPGGVVLDPFSGSGSTLCAAALEGVRAVGVEKEPEYARIAVAREAFWREHGDEGLEMIRRELSAERARERVADTGQLDLFAG